MVRNFYLSDFIDLRTIDHKALILLTKFVVQLRNHPIMTYWGFSRWPPIWIEYPGTSKAILQGEVGVLREARCSPDNSRRIFLTIEHEGAEYIGCLLMEYEFLGEYLASILKDCMGMTIESIGNLEVPLAFETSKKT